jgi:bifunctional diaminopimelate decarboxylase / aspartate kinase
MKIDKNKIVVLKYGGTSVSTISKWNTISKIIKTRVEEGFKPFIICSAISQISNKLEKLLIKSQNNSFSDLLNEIIEIHKNLCKNMDLSFDDLLGDHFNELNKLVLGISLIKEVSPKIHAKVLSYGELFLTTLGCAYLQKSGINILWYDAREHIKTIDKPVEFEKQRYLSAWCNCKKDPDFIEKVQNENCDAIITQGFIGSNQKNETVLLGRGGSDSSAAYFSSKLHAQRCEIWTDVPGIFSSNPHSIPGSRLIKNLSYEEAQEVTSAGAKVLHPHCILPLMKNKIPLHIYDTNNPQIKGTIISESITETRSLVKAITSRHNIRLISMDAVEMWHQSGFLADAFSIFKKYNISIDLVSTSETNVTVTLDSLSNKHDDDVVDFLLHDLNKICNVELIHGCALVSLVGQNIRNIMNKIGPALEVFDEKKIYLVSLSSSDLNFSVVIDETEVERLLVKLHNLLIPKKSLSSVFGKSWAELFEEQPQNQVSGPGIWWRKEKDQLLSLCKNHSPLYVYNKETLNDKINDLKSLTPVSKIFFAMKANNNSEILKFIYEKGLNFETVSIGEVKYLFELFPQIDPKRIIFTPNFAPQSEYVYGLKKNVYVTLDNIYPIKQWPKIFEGKEIFLRLDPGYGRGHHKYVHTGGAHSKFGISFDQFEDVASCVSKCGAKVIGLHAHSGSGILSSGNWSETALFLRKTTEFFPHVKILDLGGGLGIPEKPGQQNLDLNNVKENLNKFKQAFGEFELWLEPGRYLVGQAGVLLTTCTQLKSKGKFNYIGIDSGMNNLIRPALYGAYHEIVNLSQIEKPKVLKANIVGHICESGDTFGYGRRMPQTKEGDIILIGTAGAYGRVMASDYNKRPPAKEILV